MSENKKEGKNIRVHSSLCGKKKTDCHKKRSYCYTSTESCIHTRRCFMTGEYCSKQSNIQREREKIYDEDDGIKAFVVMNFSDMSNVVYKWRLKAFIESLTEYLYIDKKRHRLYCLSTEGGGPKEKKVKKIEVVRSDTDPASNYVVCNRICQQMQIADLIIVDVSSQNANVFYEFGMAVALGKLILPICYSESFYKMTYPEKISSIFWEMKEDKRNKIKHHIGLFPWRKDLFEYYGIRYKNITSETCYAPFEEVIKPEYGFNDLKYDRFPYHEVVSKDGDKHKGTISIGGEIYNKLKKEYNDAGIDDNTLVVYTMDAFLNKEQAGSCIVNFYRNITSRMDQEKCFSGERVGVLVQENVIPEDEKDSKNKMDIFYNIGEIIQIGTNQATFLAAEEKIKADDDFTKLELIDGSGVTEQKRQDIERFVKEHIKNRGMRIYPNNPVFVDRMRNLLHKDLLEIGRPDVGREYNLYNLNCFCLYHVMLRTLRYTNEIVVDISNNCLQSLFWLGAAHGSDVYAITVSHEKTDVEKNYELYGDKKENRNVFDVAGLWMAILRKDDTEGFYQQLALAQSGIERHSKLMLPNSDYYKTEMKEYLFSFDVASSSNTENKNEMTPKLLYEDKRKKERDILESYYRKCFWTPMLSYNQLCIYLSQRNEEGTGNKEPRLYMSKWDFDAVAVFTNYLSRRKLIGEYLLVSLPVDKPVSELSPNPAMINFICTGGEVYPLGKSLPDYIKEQIEKSPFTAGDIPGINIVHKRWDGVIENPPQMKCNSGYRGFKGFKRIDAPREGIITHHPKAGVCIDCPQLEQYRADRKDKVTGIICSDDEAKVTPCEFEKEGLHYETAQLILWREDPVNPIDGNYYRVGIIGSSGPATYALSTLFVAKEQRNFKKDKKADKEEVGNPLYDLQGVVRKKFMEIFLMKLRTKLHTVTMVFCDETGRRLREYSAGQKDRYFILVEHAVCTYLNTVLYRYFFPFLSEKDIDRIGNGMYTFVNSMKAARVSPFALDYHSSIDKKFPNFVSNTTVTEIVDMIPEVLRSTMKSFKGLEAFYKVTVQHCLDKREYETNVDTRKVIDIELLEDTKFPSVNCFFI